MFLFQAGFAVQQKERLNFKRLLFAVLSCERPGLPLP